MIGTNHGGNDTGDGRVGVADQALAVPVEPASGLAPSGFDPSRTFYEKRPDLFFTGGLGADGDEIIIPIPWGDLTADRRTEIANQAELEGKSLEQISGMISALTPLIDLYSKNVTNAEERYRRERAFLADLMGEYVRLTHYIARKAAQALEDTAIATEARRAETENTGSVHEGAGPQDIAPKAHP